MGNVKNKIIQSPDLQMHIVVMLWGFTAVLGKLISISGPLLVWHRIWITVLVLCCVPGVLKNALRFSKRDALKLGIIGCIIALHWVCFYGSIKMSDSASVALCAIATSTFFAAILEPILTKAKFEKFNLVLGLIVFVGVRIIFSDDKIPMDAFMVGVLGAFLAALFSTLNKKWATEFDSKSATVVELGIGFIFLTILLLIFEKGKSLEEILIPPVEDWIYLIILAVLCTAFTFVVALHCLKYISAFKSNLYVNLEPVYGIILAAIVFNELSELSLTFMLGAFIIISSVFIKPLADWVVKLKHKE